MCTRTGSRCTTPSSKKIRSTRRLSPPWQRTCATSFYGLREHAARFFSFPTRHAAKRTRVAWGLGQGAGATSKRIRTSAGWTSTRCCGGTWRWRRTGYQLSTSAMECRQARCPWLGLGLRFLGLGFRFSVSRCASRSLTLMGRTLTSSCSCKTPNLRSMHVTRRPALCSCVTPPAGRAQPRPAQR